MAVAFLKREKEFPLEFFSPLLKESKIPVISDTPQYRQSVSIKGADYDIHVSVDPTDLQKDKLNILLTERSISDVKSMKGWDAIILSSGEIFEKPILANKAIVAAGYPKGEKMGILTLQVDSSGRILDFEHRWQALGKDIKEDVTIRKVLTDYDIMVAGLLKDQQRLPTEISYLGVSKCGECHQPFVESWKETQHAAAFAALKQAGKSADPECLICHTVGFGEAGGFFNIETTPGLADVQCEECHGQNKEHLSDFSRPLPPVTASVCLECHTESSSPDFNYPVYLEKIKH